MRLFWLGWLLAGNSLAAGTDASDLVLRIVTHERVAAGARETTTYIWNDRVRVESGLSSHVAGNTIQQHPYVHIRRCDVDRILILNPHARTYRTGPLKSPLSGFQRLALSLGKSSHEAPGPPEVIVETTTVDTGEWRIAFGHAARRVLTTRLERTIESGAAREIQIDGWYIDLDGRAGCELEKPSFMTAVLSLADDRSSRPRMSFRNIGRTENGFPIESKVTRRSGGDVMSPPITVSAANVTEVSWQSLDPGFFEVPANFRSEAGFFSSVVDGYKETRYILQSVVRSWFH